MGGAGGRWTVWLTWLAVAASAAPRDVQPPPEGPRVDRWEGTIARFEEEDRRHPPPRDAVLFIGNSTIRMWDLATCFPGLPVIDRGFGGSLARDCVNYAERIVWPYQPRLIVCYTGGNDIPRFKPARVRDDVAALLAKIRARYPTTPFLFIGIAPSAVRWKPYSLQQRFNRLVGELLDDDPYSFFFDPTEFMLNESRTPRVELFRPDKLHLNADGYKLWSDWLRPVLGDAGLAPVGPD